MSPKVGFLKRLINLSTFNLTGRTKEKTSITKIKNRENTSTNLGEIKRHHCDLYARQLDKLNEIEKLLDTN